MEHGTHCHLASCNRLTFLPIRCPSCSFEHCEAHVHPDSHRCPSSTLASSSSRTSAAGGENNVEAPNRAPCAFKGCKNKTLHVLPPQKTSSSSTAPTKVFTHEAPRCPRCQLSFCSSHASPTSHACKAPAPPTEGDLKRRAADERKRKAAEAMAKFRASQAKSGVKK